ncbi:hypothetical protein [Salidesulfovibrio brasiliensis]|uniref:hypothetical protein n=1 Tax=Salidesulfovibrio brasiliensis TaxID=221711 RepID=UPI0006D1D414|nr:hypothetical protein [Salidesulfovibrio brasiliensis]
MAILDRIRNWWGQHRARKALSREVSPLGIRTMAEEVGELARLAAQVSASTPELIQLTEQIKDEMEKLENLTAQPEFKKLSTGQRILLRQGLLQSKEQLLQSIDKAASPTHRLQ